MNTKNTTQEQISAFADGELADSQIDMALAALRTPEGRATWNVYHGVGDALRCDDMPSMSPDFMARLSARLDKEPTIIAPVAERLPAASALAAHKAPVAMRSKRFVLQGMAAAAAAAALAFVAVPQLMVAMKSAPAGKSTAIVASAAEPVTPVSAPVPPRIVARQQGDVLRDPGIDEYLLAHQRFSPSVYSTAQYARSATFAVDSDK